MQLRMECQKEGNFELKNPSYVTKNHNSNIDCVHQISGIVVEQKNQLLNDSESIVICSR